MIKQADFTLYKGEIVLIMGRNGSGKSTFLRTLAQRHQVGALKIQGGHMKYDPNTKFSMISQRASTQILTYSVQEEICTPFSFRKIGRPQRVKAVNGILEKYRLQDIRYRDPNRLSSGQQQLVNIATVLSQQNIVLLMDEPFMLLDKKNKTMLVEIIKQINSQGTTIIIVQHRPSIDTIKLADRVFMFEEGNLKKIDNSEPWKPIVPQVPLLSSKNTVQMHIDVTIGRHFPVGICKIKKKLDALLLKGDNGIGKTTLLLTIYGAIKPYSGKFGGNIKKRKKIYVPQDPVNFFSKSTVQEEWEFRFGSENELPETIKAYKDTPIFELSEGQRKWISLQIAFLSDAEVIFLDEPSFSLDIQNHGEMLELLVSTTKTIFVASHDESVEKAITAINGEIMDLNRPIERDNIQWHPLATPNIVKKEKRTHPIVQLNLFFLILLIISKGTLLFTIPLLSLMLPYTIYTLGGKQAQSILKSYLPFVILAILIHGWLGYVSNSIRFNGELEFTVRIILLILSINVFRDGINPDELVDTLLKFRLPATLAWIVGAVYRQAEFMISEMQTFVEIQKERIIRANPSKKFQFAIDLMIVSYNYGIDRASNFADSLINRGWDGAYRELICFSKQMDYLDWLKMALVNLIAVVVIMGKIPFM